MVGLLDIAPLTKTVDVGGAQVSVYGVSAEGIAVLLSKFPELRQLMSGQDVDANSIASKVPQAIASIIAAGCGYPGNDEAEALANRLSADQQLDLLKAILELTMPKGARPFFDKLQAAMSVFGDVSVKTVASPSPQQLNVSSETD